MATVIQAPKSRKTLATEALSEGIGNFITKGTESYMNRADQTAIQKAVSELPPNATAKEVLSAVTGVKTYNPQAGKEFFTNYLGASQMQELERHAKETEEIQRKQIEATKAEKEEKKAAERKEADEKVDRMENLTPEQKVEMKKLEPGTINEAYKEYNKVTPFEAEKQKLAAREVSKLEHEIPAIEDQIKTIDKSLELSKKVNILLPLSENWTRLKADTFPLIEPIVKIFNPSGPIATGKLNTIIAKYAIGYDPEWVRKGKLESLKMFAEMGKARMEQRLQLYNEYNGNPPSAKVIAFDNESGKMIDAMEVYPIKAEIPPEEYKNLKLPPPGPFKGKRIDLPNGIVYTSDGEKWFQKV